MTDVPELRPSSGKGFLSALRDTIGQTASTGTDWDPDIDHPGFLRKMTVTVTDARGVRVEYDSDRDGFPPPGQVPATFLPGPGRAG